MTMQSLRIDFVSDVVCPWCIVGYLRMQKGLEALQEEVSVDLHWHPFELNPHMPPEGQNLREHIMQKYGSTEAQSKAARDNLRKIGQDLGFSFEHFEDMRIYNTARAHQLLHWAREYGKEHDLKLNLFSAYFTDGRNINDISVLCERAAEVGLDTEEAEMVLNQEKFASAVQKERNLWMGKILNAVPAFVFQEKYFFSGAQEPATFTEVIEKVLAKETTGESAS